MNVYITDVIIENYRGVRELELSFNAGPGINILLGDNGVGKTSILEAIATGLSGYLEGVSGSFPRHILSSDIRIHTDALGGASTAIHYATPVAIRCRGVINQEDFEWSRIRERETKNSGAVTHTDYSDVGSLKSYARKMTNDTQIMLPVLSYLSTERLSAPKSLNTKRESSDFADDIEKKLHDRRNGYKGCMRNAIEKDMIKAWCLKMDMEHYFQNAPIPEYEAFKEIVGITMMVMSELEQAPKIYYSRQFRDIVYQEDHLPLPISYLSAGYQSLLWIVMDIAFRIALLNPHYGSDMRFTPGVVLIDELDMHLHPKWQWNVLSALEETFPNIQFIIATHSPILISSCKHGRIISIDDYHQTTYIDPPYATDINNVVELVQGSSGIPKHIKESMNDFDYALNDGDLDTAHQILSHMKEQLGDDHRVVKLAAAELSMDYSSLNED